MRIWDVYPAIDLRLGRVVRLAQGDPTRETKYADDPLSVACRWQEAGARWVHIVNLDGAFGGRSSENLAALERILKGATGLQVQFGGGLRDLASVQRALDLGVSRVVLGTAAVHSPTREGLRPSWRTWSSWKPWGCAPWSSMAEGKTSAGGLPRPAWNPGG